MYDMTRSKWIDFYEELEDTVSTFGLKSEVLILTDRYVLNALTEVKDIIMSYLSITPSMVDSHC